MAQLDHSIPLGIRPPDILGAIQQGNALAQQQNEALREREFAEYIRANGTGIMSGDTNALAGLAQYRPEMALNIQTQNRNNARADEQLALQRDRYRVQDQQWATQNERANRQDQRADMEWQFKVEEYAASKSQAQREAEAAEIEGAVKVGLGLPDAASWDAYMQQNAPELVGQFDAREAYAQRFMEVADILKRQGGDQFRPATADEAGRYGAAAGQFGPDGRFYPVNPPSGLSVETGPDGQLRVTQGSGAGTGAGKPFTEAQSKDNVFAARAEGALGTLDPIAGELSSLGQRAANADPTGLIRGRVQSDNFQIAQNAGNEFLQAILRKDTGAAITEQEQSLYGQTYLPQPGDNEAVLAQKVQARRRAIEAIKSGMSASQIVAQERALQASGSTQVGGAQGGDVQTITDDAGYDALPAGALFKGPDGVTRRKQ